MVVFSECPGKRIQKMLKANTGRCERHHLETEGKMTIRYMIFTAAVLLSCVGVFYGQDPKEITAIRREVALIEKNAARYDKKTKLVEGLSLEGTEATYFTSGRGLKKIAAKMFGESYRATVEIYYSGEEAFFIYQKLERYVMPIPDRGPVKIASFTEHRLYRRGTATIRLLQGKTKLTPGDTEFDEAEMQMVELADQLKAAFAG
jgi:hypothetical protein